MKHFCHAIFYMVCLFILPAIANTNVETKLQDLPVQVRNKLIELFHGEIPANTSSPFNSTDIFTPDLPSRRLIFIVKRENIYYIHYAHGGYSLHTHLIGLQQRSSGVDPIVNVVFFEEFKSLAKAQEALSELKFYSPTLIFTDTKSNNAKEEC